MLFYKNLILILSLIAISIGVSLASQLPTPYYYKISYVPIQCVTVPCPQYKVQKVNTPDSEIAIENFNFPLGLEQNYLTLTEANTVIFYGVIIGNRQDYDVNDFRVIRVYKQLPQGNLQFNDKYYMFGSLGIMCITTPCPSISAILLNVDTTTNIFGINQPYENNVPLFDSQWLFQRTFDDESNRLIGLGSISSGNEMIVSSSFVRLPDPSSPCPALPFLKCQGGHVTVFERDTNRCLANPSCSTDENTRMCILSIPTCPTGYDLVSFTGISTCPVYYCDAYFVTKTY